MTPQHPLDKFPENATIHLHGGPRDGDTATIPTEVLFGLHAAGGYYVAHLRADWIDGEDDHLPPEQRIRALYRAQAMNGAHFNHIDTDSLPALVAHYGGGQEPFTHTIKRP